MMARSRILAGLTGLVAVLALLAWGCSSSDDGGQPAAQLVASDFQLTAPFQDVRPRVRIAQEYTCFCDDLSPPLSWSKAPPGTQSFALIADESEHHSGSWAHWVLFNVPAEVTELSPGIPTSTDVLPDGTKQGRNDFKNIGYNGPCPPPTVQVYATNPNYVQEGVPPRRDQFTVYALDAMLDLAAGSTRNELVSAMEGHVLAQAITAAKYAAALGLQGKEGGGFLDTASRGTQTPAEGATPPGEKIYNTLGELVTPTPAP